MRTISFKVAGVTFENRQETISLLTGKEPVRMVAEPENPFDGNAIAIIVSRGGEIAHVGYVPRNLAAEFAPWLEGESIDGRIAEVTGGFEKLDGSRASFGLTVVFELPDNVDAAKF